MHSALRVYSGGLMLVIVLALCFVLQGCSTTNPDGTPKIKVYTIGQTGPGGGIVFLDKGNYDDGWRFMEIAPSTTEVPLQWGTLGLSVPTDTAVGTGRANTEAIVTALVETGETGRAAQYCSALQLNGYDDWFLPSKDELSEVYWQLGFKQLAIFLGTGYGYWSSSQVDEEKAWGQGFSAGIQGRIEKFDTFLARPVRAF